MIVDFQIRKLKNPKTTSDFSTYKIKKSYNE